MKEVAKISAVVAKLGAGPERRSRHGRLLTAADLQGMIEAVLAEIDETVLARELQLRNDRGEEVRLEVSGRRLLRVVGASPDAFAGPYAANFGRTIAEADEPPSRALAKLLRAMATGSPSLAVRSRNPSRRPDPAETGCSPEALLDSWKRLEVQTEHADPPTVAGFAAWASPHATAFVRLVDGKVVQQEGEHQMRGELTRLSRLEACSGTGGRSCILFTAATGEGDALLCAREDNQSLLLLFPAWMTAAMTSRWSAGY